MDNLEINHVIQEVLNDANIDSEIIELIIENTNIYSSYDLNDQNDNFILNTKLLQIIELINGLTVVDISSDLVNKIINTKISRILETKY